MKITKEQAIRIYDILIQHAGASKHAHAMTTFVYHVAEEEPGVTEYRFCGKLGYGGKFRNNNGVYIDCYQEDETPERLGIIEKMNNLLKDLLTA